jgi:hypothetical protein
MSLTDDAKYPEHEKLRAVSEDSQAIGEFLDYGGYTLCKFREAGNNGEPRYLWIEGYEKDREPTWDDYVSNRAEDNPDYESWGSGFEAVGGSINDILADYFEIDTAKIEAEKRAMIDKLRERSGA